MKPILIALISLAIVLVIGILLIGVAEPISIQWASWQVQVDPLLFIALWIGSILLLWLVRKLFGLPQIIYKLFSRRKADKQTNQFSEALTSYLSEDFTHSQTQFEKINHEELNFSAQLMVAKSMLMLQKFSKTSAIMRNLTRKFPEKLSTLYLLQARWLIQMEDHIQAQQLIISELEQERNSRNTNHTQQLFSLLLITTEHTKQADEWDYWLPIAQKKLTKDNFQQISFKVSQLKIQTTENATALKTLWQQLDNNQHKNNQVLKTYLNQCQKLDIAENIYTHARTILKQQWDEQWLYQAVNYTHLENKHDLLEWLKNNCPTNVGGTYYLAIGILATRLKLWAISQDYLYQAKPNLTEPQLIQRQLVINWIEAQIENSKISQAWLELIQLNHLCLD